MTQEDNSSETQRQAARNTFNGRGLTDAQFEKAWAISGILNTEIHSRGSFKEPLTDYAHVFARDEKFDALRGEAIVRDVYQGRYGQTLNQTREALKAKEEALPEHARARALACAETIGDLIQQAPTQPFYQAQDRASVTLSTEFGITQLTAKKLMAETFEAKHGKDLYRHAKDLEATHYKPVRDAEIAARKAETARTRSRSPSIG